jgi:hypothetical protein
MFVDETQTTEPALNTAPAVAAVEDNSPPAPPTSETTTSSETTETVAAPPAAEEPVVEPERQPVRPAQRKIQNLIAENKVLRDQIGNVTTAQVPSPQLQPLSQQIQGQEIMPEDLDRLVEQREAQRSNALELKIGLLEQKQVAERAYSDFEKDAALLPRDYPELDPDSKQYSAVLEEKISERWKQLAVRPNPYNPQLSYIDPNVRLTDVAKDYIEVARAFADQGKTAMAEARDSLVDNGAIIPNSDAPKEKTFGDMTLKEQESYLRAKGHDI